MSSGGIGPPWLHSMLQAGPASLNVGGYTCSVIASPSSLRGLEAASKPLRLEDTASLLHRIKKRAYRHGSGKTALRRTTSAAAGLRDLSCLVQHFIFLDAGINESAGCRPDTPTRQRGGHQIAGPVLIPINRAIGHG